MTPVTALVMHELAICQALMEQVEQIAHEKQAERVASIHIRIGPLSGVEPRLLENAFYIARAGSVASDAELIINSMAVRVSCNTCDRLSDALPGRLVCGHCGDWRTRLISGDEMELRHVELILQEKEETPAPALALAEIGQAN